jgi:hypothetical protein
MIASRSQYAAAVSVPVSNSASSRPYAIPVLLIVHVEIESPDNPASNAMTTNEPVPGEEYETLYIRLQQIVEQLETGDLPLARALGALRRRRRNCRSVSTPARSGSAARAHSDGRSVACRCGGGRLNIEKVHRYPLRVIVAIELLSAVAVTLASVRLGRDVLRLLWSIYSVDTTLFAQLPWLDDLVQAINTADTPAPTILADLLPALLWLALALLAALLLRNSLPMVRTSARGMLVALSTTGCPCPGKISAPSKSPKRVIAMCCWSKPTVAG